MTADLPPVPPPDPGGGPPPVHSARIERNWAAISVELFAPQPSRIERWLRRLTIPPTITRLVVATPALRRAWFVALGLVVFLGLSANDNQTPDDLAALLMLAPLVPVLGVTMAYGPASDPAHEISLATPLSGFRLVMIRSATVVACSVVVLAIASVLSGAVTPLAFGWLLPAFGLTGASLSLMTFTTPRRAGVIATIGWMIAVVAARGGTGDTLAVFTAVGQAAMVTVAGIGFLVTFLRRARFDLLVEGM